MNLPATIELLNSKEYFEKYYAEEINLTPINNYMFNVDRQNSLLDKKVAKHLGKKVKEASFIFILVMTGHPKKQLDDLFGNGKGTTRLGEGRATTYFLKVLGKMVMLFHDSRGTTTEIELNLTREQYVDVVFELFKYQYDNQSDEEKNFLLSQKY